MHRFGISVNVLVQVSLLFALFGIANYLSYRHYVRRDLSPQKDFTVSDATENYLRNLKKDVEITLVFARDSVMMQEVRSLAEEYRRIKKSRIRLEEVDPVRDVDRAEQLKAKHAVTLSGNGVLVSSNDRFRFIPESELVIRGLEGDRENPSVDFRGEEAITSAIIGLVEGQIRRFYYIVGKGDSTGKGGEPSFKSLVELGKQQNFEVAPMNFSEIDKIPDDAAGVVLVGPKYDLADREATMLDAYWQAKRTAILVLIDPAASTPRLHQFISQNGVVPRADRVLYAESTSTGPRKEFSVQTLFLKDSPISQPFSSVSATFSGQTQSLDLKRESAELRAQQIEVRPLIDATERFWGETRYLMDLPRVEPGDTQPPVHLAASVERGHVDDERLRVDSSRMVVVGNALLLDPSTRLAVHQDFVAASVNWMLNRERLIGPTPKRKQSFRLDLTENERKIIFWVTCCLMPGAVLTLGMMVWSFRRA